MQAPESLIRKLPIEILRLIFIAACPSIDVRNPKGFVGRLSAVCFQWRAAVVDTPELWSDFDLSFDHFAAVLPSASSATNYLPPSLNLLVDLCLQRSKEYPISLRFVPKSCLRSIGSVLTRLLVHSNRWVRATFHTVVSYYSGLFPLPQSFNALRSLTLDQPKTFTMLRKPPQLKTLTITSFDLVSPSDLNVPWPQITEFSLELMDDGIHFVPAFWRALSNLSRLDLYLRTAHSPFYLQLRQDEFNRVELPRLTSFKIASFLNPRANDLLRTIRAQNLTDLCVVFKRDATLREEGKDSGYIVSFLERNNCRLQQLQLVGFDKDSAVTILRSDNVRTVRNMHLQGVTLTEEMMQFLRRDSYAGDVLPSLEYLTISNMTWQHINSLVKAVVSFICSRVAGFVHSVGSPLPTGYAYLKQVCISDIWVVRLVVSQLQQALLPESFSWEFGEIDYGKPGLVRLKFF